MLYDSIRVGHDHVLLRIRRGCSSCGRVEGYLISEIRSRIRQDHLARRSRQPPAIKKGLPVVESWITKTIKNRLQEGFTAATGWVPLIENRNEATAVWDGKLDEKQYACDVSADITERKDGRIKIVLKGWGPGGGEVTVVLDAEPGSREVAAVTDAKTERGMPYVAIFIGLQAK